MVELLTQREYELLSDNSKRKYDRAVQLCKEPHACGPFGGWATGHEILKELGWTEERRVVGHRTFVTLRKLLPASGNGG